MTWIKRTRDRKVVFLLYAPCIAFSAMLFASLPAEAQTTPIQQTILSSQEARLERLTLALTQTQQRMEQAQRELEALQRELLSMKQQLAKGDPGPPVPEGGTPAPLTAASSPETGTGAQSSSAEREEMQASQISTLDQVKVESVSKYPLRLTGALLLNGFVNTGRVDEAASPSSALGGKGSTGLSVSQTVLGLEADGPRLFAAVSHADLRVDFFGGGSEQGYNSAGGLLRLRTAHAALDWRHTQLFFSLDRSILNPNTPESLVALAQPELAWSGNLWSWNPQVGLSHTLGTGTRLRLQAAFIDPGDPTPHTGLNAGSSSQASPPANTAEASRRPGAEARIALLGSDDRRSAQFGVGGYFSPHFVSTSPLGTGNGFDAWAATIDYKLPLSHGLMFSGSFYRGEALGGLGGGGYKDYAYRATEAGLVIRPLDDVGGWSQLHQSVGQKISWNFGLGMDNAFSKQLRAYPGSSAVNLYGGIARNRTVYANVIYSPSAYLQLSVEYRNLYTAPVVGRLWTSNTTGVGAAYRF